MKQEFFSGLAEILSRMVSMVLVVLFYTIFFLGRGKINLDNLLAQGTLILGSIILYELMAFVFYELFSLVESKALAFFNKEAQEHETDMEDDKNSENSLENDKSSI
jgi:uncharacterized membrane protein YccC